ncbi:MULTISPECIES: hybrid sensor histidine kinase/response regulator transcription factor [unclassified Carboxylicivirga]|uniref:hybrid sensor histidine kinase/response regulator transcription factor n=1 Tax=Carboxylicivirga TaxID=1628153 RepID=UPI003D358AF0
MINARCLFLILVGFLPSVLNAHDYQISYLSIKDGLTQNEVTSIIEDKYGFIWFGTRGGLNRYDGYSFKHYKPEEGMDVSLSNPSVESLFYDSEGYLWVGTKSGGISLFDLKQDKFIRKANLSMLPSRITSLMEDHNNNMWLGTWGDGLWKYNRTEDVVNEVISNTNVKALVASRDGEVWAETKDGVYNSIQERVTINFQSKDIEIVDMIEDNDESVIWIAGWNMHLIKYNYLTNSVTQYKIKDVTGQLYEDTYSLCLDADGNILVGTWGQGLFVFDKKTETFQPIEIEPPVVTKSSINYKVILDIYRDSNSIIWLGTDGGGIVKLTHKSYFNCVGIRTRNKVLDLHVNSFLIDSNNRKWVGTRGNGLYVAEDSIYKKVAFPLNRKYNADPITIVKKVFEDPSGRIWASVDQGLYFAQQNAENKYSMHLASSLGSDIDTVRKVHDVLFCNNEMWVGTQQQGLFLFVKQKEGYKLHRHYSSRSPKFFIPDDRVTSVFKVDSEFWISTYKGLHKLNQQDSTFVPVDKLLDEPKKPLCNIILSTHTVADTIWFGTPCGLNKLFKNHEGTYSLLELTRKDGLLDDYINAILSDHDGQIWVSTNAGLSCVSHKNDDILNYIVNDRIGVVNFSEASCFQGRDSLLFFGNYKGLTYFDSRDIVTNKADSKFAISNFKVLNKVVRVSPDGVLKKSINETDTVELSYLQKEFSFDIASLDFNAPDKNRFKYQLQGYGLSNQWINLGNRHHISFSNLRPGKYTLRIRWAGSNGKWSNDMKSIVIIINPPVWRSWYALLAYVFMAFSIVWIIIRIKIKQSRLRDLVLFEKQNREKEKELIDYKLSFFTDISHELRTPLTLISAPINELMSKITPCDNFSFVYDRIKIAKRNVDKLNNLINQLLDFRKLEVGKIKLNLTAQDIVEFVNHIGNDFKQLANENSVQFQIQLPGKPHVVQFDKERMQIILHNLLSNAFKYCASPGLVKLHLGITETVVQIKVSNNGKGISKEDRQHLFERFHQSKSNQSIQNSGIGLSLSKAYIELHNGHIDIESIPDQLTTFTVKLNLSKMETKVNTAAQTANRIECEVGMLDVKPRQVKSLNTKGKGAKILIVDDNKEIRHYLSDFLSSYYEIIEAVNGESAFEAMLEDMPALLISDVMMPGMDGFELCEKVKTNPKLSHIPVLLLTAKGLPEDELLGTKKGADAYITKPFLPELFLEKVKMLLSSRKQMSQKYSKQIHLEAENVQISNKDAMLIESAIKMIEQNIDNINLDAKLIADQLAISLSTFYRRLKKITNQSPHEFIIAIKMKVAARYLSESSDTISEIAMKLGYNEVKTFRKNFKDTFNMSPSEYRTHLK